MTVGEFATLNPGVPVEDAQGNAGIVIGTGAGTVVVAYGPGGPGNLAAPYGTVRLLGPCALRWDGASWSADNNGL